MIKPTKNELASAINKTVSDVIKPNLKVLFCGINPGLYTAATGHHFARPGNRFWSTLYKAGFTERLLQPDEEKKLLELGYGITNVVQRTTLAAAELSKEEYIEGGKILTEKLIKYKPKYLAIVGIGAYRTAFNKPKARLGLQEEIVGETRIWVLPNPSGLNANYKPEDFVRLFTELRIQSEL